MKSIKLDKPTEEILSIARTILEAAETEPMFDWLDHYETRYDRRRLDLKPLPPFNDRTNAFWHIEDDERVILFIGAGRQGGVQHYFEVRLSTDLEEKVKALFYRIGAWQRDLVRRYLDAAEQLPVDKWIEIYTRMDGGLVLGLNPFPDEPYEIDFGLYPNGKMDVYFQSTQGGRWLHGELCDRAKKLYDRVKKAGYKSGRDGENHRDFPNKNGP
jgi:hypothetical protein